MWCKATQVTAPTARMNTSLTSRKRTQPVWSQNACYWNRNPNCKRPHRIPKSKRDPTHQPEKLNNQTLTLVILINERGWTIAHLCWNRLNQPLAKLYRPVPQKYRNTKCSNPQLSQTRDPYPSTCLLRSHSRRRCPTHKPSPKDTRISKRRHQRAISILSLQNPHSPNNR